MPKKLARYTCVFTCIIGSLTGVADAANNNSRDAADVAGVSRAAVAPMDVETSKNILAKALETNNEIYANLRSFVCNEQIERYKGMPAAQGGKQIDTVTATVSFENGTEHYSEIRQNTRVRPTMSSLAGAWSEGEFGTLLFQTQELLTDKTPIFQSYEDVDGVRAAVFQVDVEQEDSPWDLEVRSHHYRLSFRTNVWISESSGEILKIERVTTNMPVQMGISEIRWNVVLKNTDLNGHTWLLPSTGEYSVLYEDSGHREWNVLHFSNYHRYGSEVAIRFQ